MKWALIVLILSSWDGTYKDHKKIAVYDSYTMCKDQEDSLNNYYVTKRYICSEDLIK